MYDTHEQLSTANKANLEAALKLANTAFARAERIAALNLNTARSILQDSVANAKSLLAAKDMQEFISVQSSLARPVVDKAMAYSRDLYEIASESQDKIVEIVESQVAEVNKNLAGALDKLAKNAPAGTDAAVAAVKTAIATANSAYDVMAKTAKQVAEIVEANVAATSGTPANAVGTSAAKLKKAA